MATIATTPVQPSIARVPQLQQGDRLTREEFERRYDATPDVRAELIDGRVYVSPPISLEEHGSPHADLLLWLGTYRVVTPGVLVTAPTSIRMGSENMPEPDACMIILPEHGGQARRSGRFLEGGPELVVEVGYSSVGFDLNDKLDLYCRNGVREYIVWRTFDKALDYFILRGSEYARHTPDEQGRYKSVVFPGLWLDSLNLLKGDLATVLKFVQEGIASPEHGEFVAKLQAASESK